MQFNFKQRKKLDSSYLTRLGLIIGAVRRVIAALPTRRDSRRIETPKTSRGRKGRGVSPNLWTPLGELTTLP